MTATPFMQLYIADYLGDTLHLTTEQHGAYLLILMAMWRADGRLPNDPSKLARIARVSPRRWHLICDDVMAFFDVDGTEITQKRLIEERQKAVSISEKRSASGKLGGIAKALKNNGSGVANAKQMPQHSQKPDTREDASASLSKEIEREFHEAFWPAYPLKVGKPQALKAYVSARKRATFDEIMSGLRRYAVERAGQDKQFTKQAQGWLNRDGWADEPVPPPSPRQSTDPPRPPRNAGELSYQQLMGQTDEHSNQNDRRLGSGDGDAETPNLGGFQKFAISGELLRRM